MPSTNLVSPKLTSPDQLSALLHGLPLATTSEAKSEPPAVVKQKWREAFQLVLAVQTSEAAFDAFASSLGTELINSQSGLRYIYLEATDEGIISSSEPFFQQQVLHNDAESVSSVYSSGVENEPAEETQHSPGEAILSELYDWIWMNHSPAKVTEILSSQDASLRCTSTEIVIFVDNCKGRMNAHGIRPTLPIPTTINVELHWHFNDRTSPSWKINLHIEPDPVRFIHAAAYDRSVWFAGDHIDVALIKTWLLIPHFWTLVSNPDFKTHCEKARKALHRNADSVHSRRVYPWPIQPRPWRAIRR
jgi:hypothetical protein